MARAWYSYNGVGDPLTLSSYNLSPIKPACINGTRICAIYAYNGGPSPVVLSTNLRLYIATLQATSVAQPDSSISNKKYVYGKSC
ncbi:soluble lytic murein transglycosylase-like protein [Pedobacter cryoconitis]|nr:soluble lytic murein transglycosylase-like protein [Pedobacter cryoconitis]